MQWNTKHFMKNHRVWKYSIIGKYTDNILSKILILTDFCSIIAKYIWNRDSWDRLDLQNLKLENTPLEWCLCGWRLKGDLCIQLPFGNTGLDLQGKYSFSVGKTNHALFLGSGEGTGHLLQGVVKLMILSIGEWAHRGVISRPDRNHSGHSLWTQTSSWDSN